MARNAPRSTPSPFFFEHVWFCSRPGPAPLSARPTIPLRHWHLKRSHGALSVAHCHLRPPFSLSPSLSHSYCHTKLEFQDMVSMSKRLFLGLLATLSAGAGMANAACTGTSELDIPYSITSTKTGDGKSTSFHGLVCALGCSEGMLCSDLSSVSIGGVSLGGGDSSDECGSVYNVGLTTEGGCQTFSFTTDKSGVDLESVCPNGCNVRFNFANGESAVRTIGGGRVESTPTASPPLVSPEVSPSPASPEISPSPIEPTSDGDTAKPASTNTPSLYGSMRRRGRHMNAATYGGARRRLSQY